MSSRDAGFLYLERPNALLHIGCVATVAGNLDRDAVIARVESRLPRMRRYAQRVAPVPFALGHPTWEDDPDFALRDHIHRWALPSPGGEAELTETVATLLAMPLERDRPLWEMHLLEGLHDGRTALLQKVHHCMVDGLAGAQLLEALLDANPATGAFEEPKSVPAPPLPDAPKRAGRAVVDGFWRQLRLAGTVLGTLRAPHTAQEAASRMRAAAWSVLRLAVDDLPQMPWNAPIGKARRLSFTRLPLAAVRNVRMRHAATVNDVVLCALAGGLRQYLLANGIATRSLELTALVPVSLRDARTAAALGNRISAMLVPLCVDLSEELPRLAATRAITERLKHETAWTGIDALLSALDEAPAPIVAMLGSGLRVGRLANLVATNVPGPRETRWLCGRQVEALFPIVPIVDGIGLGMAVLSYDGWLHVGLNADAELMPDLDKLAVGIETAFARLARG
jgi:WS/DGAT/MGAT family acyltransferase